MSTHDPIPPELRARLRGLRLLPRAAATGHGFGQHASRNRGSGLEFAQYRGYEPGDEPRRIDWKLYARADRFFVREAERDSALTVWVVVDTSASMAQADAARPAWSKLEAARVLAACVFELALRQGDRYGLVAIGGDGAQVVPAGVGPRQRDRCLLELARLSTAGHWPGEATLRPLWERIAAGDLVLFLSDGFDDGLVALAERLAAARRDVLMMQILSAEERDFPFRGDHRFRDPETTAERVTDADAARAGYLQRFAAARAALDARLRRAGIRHTQALLDEPLDAALRRLLGGTATERAPA